MTSSGSATSPSTNRPHAIPVPTDHSAVEYDAPPPGDKVFLPVGHRGLYPQRPSSRIVDNPSQKPRVVVRGDKP